jgi:hypothetical protein
LSLKPFKPSRGLRQGDPLSPYLFLFVADGLSKLFKKEIQIGDLRELKICRNAPGISHLLFADDTLLLLEASEEQAEWVNQLLRKYEKGTGQLINPAKCSVMFSSDCDDEDKKKVKAILKVELVAHKEKYLGLPTLEGRMCKDSFKSTKQRLAKRFTSWAERYMSGCKGSFNKIHRIGNSEVRHGCI